MRTSLLASAAVALVLVACGGKVDGPTCIAAPCEPTPSPSPTNAPAPNPSPTVASPAPLPGPKPSPAKGQAEPDLDCPRPYMGLAPDGRCVWSCSEGTEPARDRDECVCSEGKSEVGTDTFGRRVCQ